MRWRDWVSYDTSMAGLYALIVAAQLVQRETEPWWLVTLMAAVLAIKHIECHTANMWISALRGLRTAQTELLDLITRRK